MASVPTLADFQQTTMSKAIDGAWNTPESTGRGVFTTVRAGWGYMLYIDESRDFLPPITASAIPLYVHTKDLRKVHRHTHHKDLYTAIQWVAERTLSTNTPGDTQ